MSHPSLLFLQAREISRVAEEPLIILMRQDELMSSVFDIQNLQDNGFFAIRVAGPWTGTPLRSSRPKFTSWSGQAKIRTNLHALMAPLIEI
jgi:hypothetical protein